MAFDITTFKGAMLNGGARPSLFQVELAFTGKTGSGLSPSEDGTSTPTLPNTNLISFMCKATSIPASTIAPIEVPYFGRKVKFAGNRTFPEWTITVINDEGFELRKTFEAWMASINSHKSNVNKFGGGPLAYQAQGSVTQYGKDGSVNGLRKYNFVNVFPSELSPIELNWGSENEIEEFTVTLQYDYWYAEDSAGASTSGAPASGAGGAGGGGQTTA